MYVSPLAHPTFPLVPTPGNQSHGERLAYLLEGTRKSKCSEDHSCINIHEQATARVILQK